MYQCINFVYLFKENRYKILAPDTIYSGGLDLAFSFDSGVLYSDIRGINFGYKITNKENLVQEEEFPKSGITYESADTTPILTERFEIAPDTHYEINVWVLWHGLKVEETFNIPACRPKKPYPSWIWNGEDWEAPVPKKWDRPYQWNEDMQKWEIDEETPTNLLPGYEVE